MGRRRQPFRYLTRLPVAEIAAPPGEPPPPEAVERVARALGRQGQREPVLVAAGPDASNGERQGPAYRLVVGSERLAAARHLRWEEMDAVVLDGGFADELSAIERLQGGSYEPLELAGILQRLQERCGWTQAQVGTAIGRNRDFVAGLLAVTDITPEVREYLARHGNGRPLSARHLRYIGRAAKGRQLALAREILEHGLSTKVLEQRFRRGSVPREFIKVRALRQPGRAQGPKTTQQWRRYYRKLRTDLRRIDEQEAHELRRTADVIAQARQRQRLIRQEARAKRQSLDRELRRATRQLARRGSL
ncbi:MAG TPA: ParB N-terminal domain-containing protein [bacterium]|nr:ParB N-terminal domain-containing protein [bacterium]